MERLDEAVARVLAGLRAQLDGKAGAGVEPAPEVPARRGDGITARGMGDRLSPPATVRRVEALNTSSNHGRLSGSLELK